MDYDWQYTQSRLTEAVRDNPLPLALIGLGIGWLVVSGIRGGSFRGSDYSGARQGLGYGSTETTGYGAASAGYGGAAATGYARGSGAEQSYESMEGQASTTQRWRERASEMGSRVSHRAQEWVGSARDRVSSAGVTARRQAGEVADRSLHTFQEHPIMIGSVALLVGAAIAASLPRTRREDELLGDTRDQMLRQARDSGVVEKVRHVGERAAEAARESGQEAFERVKETTKDAAGEVFQHVKEAARDEAERQDLPGSQQYRH